MLGRSANFACQPSSFLIFSELATSTAGSPGRLGDSLAGMGCPVTWRTVDHFAHAETLAVTEVVDEAVFPLERLENEQMGVRQIAHVNVIADAGAVRCRIVVSENGELL